MNNSVDCCLSIHLKICAIQFDKYVQSNTFLIIIFPGYLTYKYYTTNILKITEGSPLFSSLKKSFLKQNNIMYYTDINTKP